MLNKKKLTCDLCVVGGGMAGLTAAVSAAREGIKVVLMHERPVLGGNASSEIRMWVCGARGRDNRETGILEEIMLENLYRNPTKNFALWDSVLYDFVRREPNITLLLNCACMDATTETGEFADGRTTRIRTVTGYQLTTQSFIEVEAGYFCDSSGDSILAPLTGADFRIGREAAQEFGEDTDRTEADAMTMGMSCMIQGRETLHPVTFTPPTWSTKLTEKDFENREPDIYDETENFWYLELGGDRDSIADTEELRDQLVPLALGTWDYIKNSGKFNSQNWDLDFLGFLPGKRESRRLIGEVMVTQRDVCDGTVFPDEIAYGGWPIDDHFPGGFYHRGVPNTDYKTHSPYSIPYRCLYSKNVENLFFAGRNVSMTHLAMSSMRVMATCALMGEAVGKAAALATNHNLTPHGVYTDMLPQLQKLLLNEDCFLPSIPRPVSDACRTAGLNAPDCLRNGQDRVHTIYEENAVYAAAKGETLTYTFAAQPIASVHIVFDSDLNRETLPGGWCEQGHSTRAQYLLNSPVMHMPTTLCREFKLIGQKEGVSVDLLHVTDNRKRSYHLPVNGEFDTLTLIPLDSWGHKEIPVISFDFS